MGEKLLCTRLGVPLFGEAPALTPSAILISYRAVDNTLAPFITKLIGSGQTVGYV